MDSVYGSNVSGTAPAAPAVPLVGFPRAGNSLTGEKATRPGPYWFHMITQEQRNVIVAAGLTPDAADLTQLVQAIQLLGSLPAGAEIDWGGPIAPPGFMKLNGGVPLVTSVQKLVDNVYCGDANNATASFYYRCTDPLNPSTTRDIAGAYFVLKDARGRGARGLSDGSTLDAGRSPWSYQGPNVGYFTVSASADDGDGNFGSFQSVTGMSFNGTQVIGNGSGSGTVYITPQNMSTDNHPVLRCVKL